MASCRFGKWNYIESFGATLFFDGFPSETAEPEFNNAMTERRKNHQKISIDLKRTLIAAAIVHVLFTVLIYFLGFNDLIPGMFNAQGIGEFASDGNQYMREIASLVDTLRSSGMSAFVLANGKLHIKVYAISFALLSRFFGFTILSAEPVNLMAYLGILWLIYTLGQEIFTPKVGLLSVRIVGLWPSFLLYTTQLYKTPLFVVVFLGLVLIGAHLFSSDRRPGRIALHCMIGLFLIVILWFLRNEWWPLFVAILILPLFFLMVRMIAERRLMLWNMIALVIFFLSALWIRQYAADFLHNWITPSTESTSVVPVLGAFAKIRSSAIVSVGAPEMDLPTKTASEHPVKGWFEIFLKKLMEMIDAFAFQLGQQRYGFASISASGSNVGDDYEIRNARDLIRFLPRAFGIGVFSPFPGMWFSGGAKLGLSARLASGLETLCMYGIYGFSILGIWHARRKLMTWYLIAVSLLGMMALGMVITNIGALFRFRYAFWMIIIVFGVGGYNSIAYPFMLEGFRRFRKKANVHA